MRLSYSIILVIFSLSILSAQNMSERKIVLLPLLSNGIDQPSAYTAESILRMELGKQTELKIITEKRTMESLSNEICADEECSQKIGTDLGADQVVLCKLNILGEKIIVHYFLVDVRSGRNILSENTTAINLDDLEPVMKWIAVSVVRQTPFSENVEVGNVVGNETLASLRRKSRYNFGVGFGYLFPQEGYDSEDRSFTFNAYFDHEINDYAVGLMAGAQNGLAVNIYGNYLFSDTDVCPYVGTSLGVHWVQHDEYYGGYSFHANDVWEEENKSGNGIEIGLNTGIRLLHTYNVQLFVNLGFTMTFNDYNDKAIIFTIGIL